MFSKIAVAAATLIALSVPAFAAATHIPAPRVPTQHWVVLDENSNGDCFVTDRQPMPAETQMGKSYPSRSAAEAALNNNMTCISARTSQSGE